MKTENHQNHLELIIPASIWPDAHSRQAIWHDLPMPSLALLAGKGKKTTLAQADHEAYLAALFGVDTLPVAPLLLANQPDLPAGYWLCADPVTLRVDRDHLTVLGEPYLEVTQAEADALVAALNALYRADGFEFIAPTSQRWFVRLPADPELRFTPIYRALGQNLNDVLPQGAGALKFNALLNEMQMLLYSHGVNDARDAAGQLLINSIWLWGNGNLPCGDIPQLGRPLFANDPVLAALSASALPTGYSDTQARNAVIVLDQLRLHALYGAGYDWQQVWLGWEQQWFAPALAALRNGELSSLTLSFSDAAQQITVTRADLWRFWRRSALPAHFTAVESADVAD
ncbi:hypothetical protein ABHF33_15980 [Chitinibacter sp. FCG-7]|uniref:Phosphoglycerate mutase n=1 Tax=Chitinibacter mangrovi TaxID=3153927 RepID=A0AAU7F8N6_9NEIS